MQHHYYIGEGPEAEALISEVERRLADIKAAEKDAMTASREWRRGKIDTEVLCEVLADYTTMEIIAVDIEPPHDIVNRRPMTAEERNKPLPGLYSNASYTIVFPDNDKTTGEVRQ